MFEVVKRYYNKITQNRWLEIIIWVSGLIYLASLNPYECGHFTICPFNYIGDVIGLHFCPGCGVGNSITHLFHGNISESFNTHPLGMFALLVISTRIISLLMRNIRQLRKENCYG